MHRLRGTDATKIYLTSSTCISAMLRTEQLVGDDDIQNQAYSVSRKLHSSHVSCRWLELSKKETTNHCVTYMEAAYQVSLPTKLLLLVYEFAIQCNSKGRLAVRIAESHQPFAIK